MKKLLPLFLSFGCGLLLWAAWPVSPLTILIFVAWIPLLYLESIVSSRKKFFAWAYLTMLTWNVATTWWICNASVPGALGAFFANSLLMCFPWLGFSIAKKWLGERIGYITLIAFWMCFEYIHLHDWGLSWPWLTLGNAMATHPEWIQWYEYTGTSGGTLWILAVNILLFQHVKNNTGRSGTKSYKYMLQGIAVLIIPIGISFLLNIKFPMKRGAADDNVVVVQPNIDPYEKIFTGSFESQLEKLIHTTEEQMDNHTKLVVWPETALYMGNGIEETEMKENHFLNPLWFFLKRHPEITLFTGIESYRVFPTKETPTAKEAAPGYFYDAYNGSVLLDSSGPIAYYHKSMLVPGVETLPWFLKFIDTWFEKFGGTTAGYAKQDERTVLNDTAHGYKIAPAICYESIYGEYMSRYVRNGANIICIITNDGWWGNTPGYKQHMNYARLRAIETRTWVARSANTGISCFIDPYGTVINPQPWDKAVATKAIIPKGKAKETFYVKYGDVLSKLMVAFSIIFLGWTITLVIRQKINSRKEATAK
ncbi:MAG: apolipoprotein N-acyltransferase [Chitinophagaceae bacterium]